MPELVSFSKPKVCFQGSKQLLIRSRPAEAQRLGPCRTPTARRTQSGAVPPVLAARPGRSCPPRPPSLPLALLLLFMPELSSGEGESWRGQKVAFHRVSLAPVRARPARVEWLSDFLFFHRKVISPRLRSRPPTAGCGRAF